MARSSLVVHTSQQLLHVVVGIVHVVRAVLRTPEGVYRIYRPVTGCFVIGSRGTGERGIRLPERYPEHESGYLPQVQPAFED